MAAGDILKKNVRDNEEKVEVRGQEFVPYACHYDSHTIITKNGELMQVIKIDEPATDINTGKPLRDGIRESIKSAVKTDDFAFWIHTVRRKKPDRENRLRYINDVYISILAEGEKRSKTNLKNFFRNLKFSKEFEQKDSFFSESVEKLNVVTASVINSLNEFGATKLTIKKYDDGIYYSEILSFLGKIINLKESPVPLIPADISYILPSQKISFGFNMLEVRNDTETYFSSILTIKEYQEIAQKYIDDLMQIPSQFIITESFNFIDNRKFLKDMDKSLRILRTSGDKTIGRASGLEEILNYNENSNVNFGEHQLSIMVIGNNIATLEKELENIISFLNDLGVLLVREDMLLEDCYWSQLPGNFVFIKRRSPISVNKIAGYTSFAKAITNGENNNGI